MNNIFEQLFQYGFHDTEISSVEGEGLEIKLNFDNGIYLLDENGKETILSKPMQVIFRIDSYFDSFEDAFEIKEYGKKVKYLDYLTLKKIYKKKYLEYLCLTIVILIIVYYLMVEFQKKILCFLLKALTKLLFKN